MINLMKYEFRKQIFTKIVLIALTAVCEIMFLFAIAIMKDDMIRITNQILWFLFAIGMFDILFETTAVFGNDIGHKQGYLLFMTPNSNYRIAGAKLLTGAVQMFFTFTFFISICAINQELLSFRYQREINQIDQYFNAFGDKGFSFLEYFDTAIFVTIIWIWIMTISFMTISLSHTYLSKANRNLLTNTLIFIGIMFVEIIVTGLFMLPALDGNTSLMNGHVAGYLIIGDLMFILPAVLNFYIVCKLLDKKMNL